MKRSLPGPQGKRFRQWTNSANLRNLAAFIARGRMNSLAYKGPMRSV
jgi:hypothetical protein